MLAARDREKTAGGEKETSHEKAIGTILVSVFIFLSLMYTQNVNVKLKTAGNKVNYFSLYVFRTKTLVSVQQSY